LRRLFSLVQQTRKEAACFAGSGDAIQQRDYALVYFGMFRGEFR
jgi:hypothetical protein